MQQMAPLVCKTVNIQEDLKTSTFAPERGESVSCFILSKLLNILRLNTRIKNVMCDQYTLP